MKRLLLTPLLIAGFFSPIAVKANPYQMGMQWCQMVRSGMDAAASWNMIKEAYINGSFEPISSSYRGLSDGIANDFAAGLNAAMNLNKFQPDIIRTTDANCPEYGLYFESRAERRRRIRRDKGLPETPQRKISSPMDMD